MTYLTTGHGERNWTQSEPDEQADRAGLRQLKSLLEDLNYRVERLGLSQGLGRNGSLGPTTNTIDASPGISLPSPWESPSRSTR